VIAVIFEQEAKLSLG